MFEVAYKQYYKYKGDVEDLRMTFLQEKALGLEDKADKRHKRIKKMIKDEEQRQISRKMGRISSKTRKGGLSTVTIVENEVEIHKLKDRKIVEECIKEARTRFK